MSGSSSTKIGSLPPVEQARRLLPLAEQALVWWERFVAANRQWLDEHPPAVVDAPRCALALARSLVSGGAPPTTGELAELARHIQAAGEVASENVHSSELALEAAAAVAVVATPLALVATAHDLADDLDWEVEASPSFALTAAEELRGLDDARLEALLDELG